jgi:SulP family sulfate permease
MLNSIIKSLSFFKTYPLKNLKRDLIAGIALGAVLIPIGLAFGDLAGVGGIVGIKAAIIPLIIYSIFSSSRLIIIGPDASTAALVGSALVPLAQGDHEMAITIAAAFSLFVGLMFLIAGISRLGFIADFIPKPVLVGFMSALGIMIIIDQMGKVSGIKILAEQPMPALYETFLNIPEMHVPTIILAIISILIIRACSKWTPSIPGPVVAMVLGIIAVKNFGIDQYGIKIIGELPTAMPSLSWPIIPWEKLASTFSNSLSIAIIAFTDSILIARVFAARSKSEMDPDAESIALGLSNISGGLTQTLPVAISATRTSLAESLGAQTRLVGFIAPIVIILFMWFDGGNYLSYMPRAVLGAILVMAGVRLIEYSEFFKYYKIRKLGLVIAAITFIGVLSVGILEGVFISVVISFFLVINNLIKIPSKIIREHNIRELSGMLMLNVGPGIFFANVNTIRNNIHEIINNEKTLVKYVIIDGISFINIDLAGAEMLGELQKELAAKDMKLGLICSNSEVNNLLINCGLSEDIRLFKNMSDFKKTALEWI